MRTKRTLLATMSLFLGMAVSRGQVHAAEVVSTNAVELSVRPSTASMANSIAFDPFIALAPSSQRWNESGNSHWWNDAVVEAIAEGGPAGTGRRTHNDNVLTSSFLRQVELGLTLPLSDDLARESMRLRVRLNVKHKRPQVGFIFEW